MLDFDQKNALYSLIPSQYTVHRVDGTTEVLTVEKFMMNQLNEVVYPMINIGWESEGRPALGIKPTFLRLPKSSPVAWDENVGTPVRYKVIQGNLVENITVVATELEIFRLDLFTGKAEGSTSSMKVSIIENSSGKTVKEILVNNEVILNNDWTEIEIEHDTEIGASYTLRLSDVYNDEDSAGVRLYQDFSGELLYSVKRKRFVEVHGGPVTTDIVITVHAKDVQGSPFMSGETVSSEIMTAIWKEIHKSLEQEISTLKMDGFAEPVSITEQVSGEYIYGQRLSFSVIYELNWEVEVAIVKEVTIRKLELKL